MEDKPIRDLKGRFVKGGHWSHKDFNYFWKGGRIITPRGYIMLRCEGHPRATPKGNGDYVFEHILVMEKHIGRYITINENVHHINGNRQDNRIENLQLMTRGQHTALEWKLGSHKKQPRDPITGRFIPTPCGKKSARRTLY